MIRYRRKCLLIEEGEGRNKERALVVGDIHLGAIGKIGGVNVERQRYYEMIKELDNVFDGIGKVDKIILLGDLKDKFSGLEEEERYNIVNLFDYLEEKCKEIVVIRGNHDNYLLNILKYRGMGSYIFYIWKEYCFLHGDKDFAEIYDKEIKYWVMGHLHPAVSLREGTKTERYKCFLEGEFKMKKIIILPSFSEIGEGVDVLEVWGRSENNLAWNFDLGKFRVKIIGEKLEVLDFGKVSVLAKSEEE